MFTAGDAVGRARYVLLDTAPEFQRNTDTELLKWLDDAIVSAISLVPTVRSISQVLTLVAGSLQTLPERTIQLLDVTCNVAPNGTTRGRTIRVANRQMLDDQEPAWRARKQASTLYHYCYDERVQREFDVYPPAIAGTKVEARLAIAPPQANELTDQIEIDEQYLPALVSYIVAMAEAKDSEASNAQLSAAFMAQFKAMLEGQAATMAAVTPNNLSAT